MQSSITNATEMGPHNAIEFADFGVYKVWQCSKSNVRRDPIFKI